MYELHSICVWQEAIGTEKICSLFSEHFSIKKKSHLIFEMLDNNTDINKNGVYTQIPAEH